MPACVCARVCVCIYVCPCLERVLIYILVHTDMYLITVSLTRCPQHTEGGGEREGVEEGWRRTRRREEKEVRVETRRRKS